MKLLPILTERFIRSIALFIFRHSNAECLLVGISITATPHDKAIYARRGKTKIATTLQHGFLVNNAATDRRSQFLARTLKNHRA